MCCLPAARHPLLRRLSALLGLSLSYLNNMLSTCHQGQVLDLWE